MPLFLDVDMGLEDRCSTLWLHHAFDSPHSSSFSPAKRFEMV